ncbi:MAG: hypothetical protein ACE5D0_04360 [Fidelibacterota bacterium]
MGRTSNLKKVTTGILLVIMGIYSHESMSHLGHPHFYRGTISSDLDNGSVYENIQFSEFGKCPWSKAGYLFQTACPLLGSHQIINSETILQLPQEFTPLSEKILIESRAPPVLS